MVDRGSRLGLVLRHAQTPLYFGIPERLPWPTPLDLGSDRCVLSAYAKFRTTRLCHNQSLQLRFFQQPVAAPLHFATFPSPRVRGVAALRQ